MNQSHESHELEPIATRPALRMFVEAAREQPIAPTRLSAHEVQRAYQQQQQAQRHSRRQLVLGLSLGSLTMAAAAALALFVLPGLRTSDDAATSPLATAAPTTIDALRGEAPREGESTTPTNPLALNPAIHVTSSTEAPQVLGPWTIALQGGEHAVRVEPSAGRALRIELPERTLELVHGELDVQIVPQADAAPFVLVRLESGVAAWIGADGSRTQIEVERIDVPVKIASATTEIASAEPSAAELARKAEQQLLSGAREDAIGTLRKLVRKYPRTPQSRTALLDLARQERLAGQPDRARCAYLLYLERWPHSEVRGEIDKQLGKLGEGPACRGLDPR